MTNNLSKLGAKFRLARSWWKVEVILQSCFESKGFWGSASTNLQTVSEGTRIYSAARLSLLPRTPLASLPSSSSSPFLWFFPPVSTSPFFIDHSSCHATIPLLGVFDSVLYNSFPSFVKRYNSHLINIFVVFIPFPFLEFICLISFFLFNINSIPPPPFCQTFNLFEPPSSDPYQIHESSIRSSPFSVSSPIVSSVKLSIPFYPRRIHRFPLSFSSTLASSLSLSPPILILISFASSPKFLLFSISIIYFISMFLNKNR